MGIADEIEEWLLARENLGTPDEITESPKFRWNKRNKFWYRKCHRCDYNQTPCGQRNYFPMESHACMRDSTLIFIKWPEKQI